ncbi:MAG: hypothetical protein ACL93V_13070 [Candidatus Electrothrix sp. YB6]
MYRINVKTIRLGYEVLAVLLFLIMPSVAIALEDNYEENDDYTTAFDLTSHEGEDLSVLNGPGYYNDGDWYKITVGMNSTQVTVALTYTHEPGKGIDLFLYKDSAPNPPVYIADTEGEADGFEVIAEDAEGGATYYIKVNGEPDIGTEYDLIWNDDDNGPEISDPDPADGATVSPDPSGKQLLQVVVSADTESCTIHYGTDSNASNPIAGTITGDYCETNIPYSADMLDNGTNYWYVEADNETDTTRFPSTGTLSFTVSGTEEKPKAMPWLMLLLNNKSSKPPAPKKGKAMPWLMLLLDGK